MAFPEKALVEDEQVLLHTGPHARRMIVPVVVLFAASTAAGVAAGLLTRSGVPGSAARWLALAIVVVWALVVGWWTVRPWLARRAMHLVLTDQRLMYRTGIARRRGLDFPLRRIYAVRYHQRLADRLLGAGVLMVESAGAEPIEFPDIPRISDTHARIVAALDEYAERP